MGDEESGAGAAAAKAPAAAAAAAEGKKARLRESGRLDGRRVGGAARRVTALESP